VTPIVTNDAKIRDVVITNVKENPVENVIVRLHSSDLSAIIQYPVAKVAINRVTKIK